MPTSPDPVPHWFALRVRPRAEKQVAMLLRRRGFEEFLPITRQRRRWSDRVKDVDLPLFPGYVFSRFVVDRRQPILMIPGVINVVSGGHGPQPVDDTEMASLQTLVRSDRPVDPWPEEFVGRRVRLLAGPLAGAEGTLVSVRQHTRLIVHLSLLQRSVAVEVSEHDAWPVSAPALHLSTY
ncbi:MAG: UpxY family transcription antiterminator [Vicinamibacterales bacterium]